MAEDDKPLVKLTSLRRDAKRDSDGEWVDLIEVPGVRMLLRPLDFPAFRIARDMLAQRMARKYGAKPAPPEVLTTEIGKLLADHILLDWDGFDEPYSLERARELMTDYEWRQIATQVQSAASTLSITTVEFVGDAVKN